MRSTVVKSVSGSFQLDQHGRWRDNLPRRRVGRPILVRDSHQAGTNYGDTAASLLTRSMHKAPFAGLREQHVAEGCDFGDDRKEMAPLPGAVVLVKGNKVSQEGVHRIGECFSLRGHSSIRGRQWRALAAGRVQQEGREDAPLIQSK